MEKGPVKVPTCNTFDVPQSHKKRGPTYLTRASDRMSTHKHKKSRLSATWRRASLDDTIYRGRDSVVNGWGKFYLPERVHMQVIGVAERTSCLCEQLVLMTCEDREEVYAYDGEELHVVASSLQQLCNEGIEYPASKSYYNGEAFKDMTEKDWAKVKKSPVGKSLDQAHHKLVTAEKSKFLAALKSM